MPRALRDLVPGQPTLMEAPRPEYRYEPLRREWVIVSPGRAARPRGDVSRRDPPAGPEAVCPFCPGHERETPPELYAVRDGAGGPDAPGWRVRVVPNKYPALAQEFPPEPEDISETDRAPWPAYGFHEVVIETPEHSSSLAERSAGSVFETLVAWRERTRALSGRGVACVQIFRNEGVDAGATILHPHSQIVAPAVLPQILALEVQAFRTHRLRTGHCLLCDRIERENELRRRSIARTDHFAAFCPFAGRVPFEMCVLPLACARDFRDVRDEELSDLAAFLPRVFHALSTAARNPPFNLLLHSSPLRAAREPDAPFHWHVEILPRTSRIAGFEWASGVQINQVPPEVGARKLREALEGEPPHHRSRNFR